MDPTIRPHLWLLSICDNIKVKLMSMMAQPCGPLLLLG